VIRQSITRDYPWDGRDRRVGGKAGDRLAERATSRLFGAAEAFEQAAEIIGCVHRTESIWEVEIKLRDMANQLRTALTLDRRDGDMPHMPEPVCPECGAGLEVRNKCVHCGWAYTTARRSGDA
jgi:hypothetical protein